MEIRKLIWLTVYIITKRNVERKNLVGTEGNFSE